MIGDKPSQGARARAGNFRPEPRAVPAKPLTTAESRRAILRAIFPSAGQSTFQSAAGSPAIYLNQVHCLSVIRTMAMPISTPCQRPATTAAVLITMVPKHERQHQQARRPCDHHSQQEPLKGFHYRVPTLIFPDLDGRPAAIPVWLAFMSTAFHRPRAAMDHAGVGRPNF